MCHTPGFLFLVAFHECPDMATTQLEGALTQRHTWVQVSMITCDGFDDNDYLPPLEEVDGAFDVD